MTRVRSQITSYARRRDPAGELHGPETPGGRPDGNPSKNALRTAKSGGRGVGAVEDLDDDKRDALENMIDDLANDHLEETGFGTLVSNGRLPQRSSC